MDEYIKRKDAISAICFGCNQEFSDEPCEPKECYIRQAISNTPTADVVPKSEVASIFDELIKEASEIAEYYKKEADGMSCSEYAKIEYRGTQIGALLVQYKIAELKKKHTESEGER